jgi:anti-anti-sigma factor
VDNLEVELTSGDSFLAISFTGELDYVSERNSGPRLRRIAGSVPGLLILDVGGVTLLDASGVALLLSLFEVADAQGGSCVLANVHGLPQRVLDMLRIDEVMPMIRSEIPSRPWLWTRDLIEVRTALGLEPPAAEQDTTAGRSA